ncbi:hypothetical protein I6J18_22740 [Peribacillus psychrosaccharolyticus]|uniref:Uncharacterized protein n=1 Tax=Peribacillus psychrosaccharolyticus TaxID=1407 RepID=A0A974NLZ0_PERPY|nr:hypothetical protein [Peribacillus psychrosaccharolyticus]MEC2056506.1 hypothetical protein [Peribacillus psychrosaccharolyticus]MED3745638.1 hypothetical protein [Peribacillus psychrosaccharolyticus]QQT00347.1 hypothetical protein I6J18_22740 [Peribacillus psychrosaccharolyticus]
MSKKGLKVAIEYGEKLREFKNILEAEKFFFKYKDELLIQLELVSKESDIFKADYKVGSLKNLEKWYFELYEKNEFFKLDLDRNEFEKVMAIYFGEVVVQNNKDAKWEVEEYPFVPGKYTFLVIKDLGSMSLGNGFIDHYKEPSNKRRNSLIRMYNHYFTD